jgi:Fe-S-cluster-containing dehydrogenase component
MAVLLDPDACTGCQACLDACPFSAVIYNVRTGKVQLCDLCEGKPECVDSCPHGAIVYAD